MNFVDFVFFFYTFVGLYMLSLIFLVYFPNRKRMFHYPKGRPESVSIVIPCYNESKTIGKVIESMLNLNYPKTMLEIIVVDDKSTDNSVEVVKKYVKRYKNLRLIVNKRNSGGAAEPTNIGIKVAKYDYIAVADADSAPEKNALLKIIGFLQKDKTIAGATGAILVRYPKNFVQRLQALEYIVISFTRKLLDFVDAVYVTPGPFAVYRKDVLFKIGLFDTKNMTQDIEIVWRMMAHGYKSRMALDAKIYTEAPKTFKQWWKQRIRWDIGGTQTLIKYRKWIFRKNMLGMFIIPFFSSSLFIGTFGLGLLIYLIFKRFFLVYLSTKFSIITNTAILTMRDLSFNPSILNFFGISLFLLGVFYAMFGIIIMKELKSKYVNFYTLSFFLTVYLAIYPIIMIVALYKMAIRKYSW